MGQVNKILNFKHQILTVCRIQPYALNANVILNNISCSVKKLSPESELFTGDTSKDNHSPGPVLGKLVPSPHKRSKLSN